ncbi:TPA: aminoacyl-tRNA deacylase [Candidatus Bathyarchaeota archaeon]|nr:aminoacyl-tRNA deacylase [Candidatus Bathyarchaeota archaeon]
MTKQDLLKDYLKQMGIWHRFIEKKETIHTADAAKAAGLELHRVTKNLVSKTNEGEPVLLIIPGNKRVRLKSAARALSARRVSLVSFEEAEKISGYPPGGTPSIGHKTKMRTVIDKSLLQYETIYCGGGSRERLLELRTEDVIKLNNAIVAEISK